MLRHLVAAILVMALHPDLGMAQTNDRNGSTADALAVKADLRDPARRDATLSAIAGWLSQKFDLPQATALPHIAFATPAELLRRRYRIIRGNTGQSAYETPAQSTAERTVAIYDDSSMTIYLAQDWRGDSAADVSVVVHEMVHHLQNVGHLRFACAREREKAAYDAQERWLQARGGSLREDFDIDPFTVLVNSTCLN
jgi:hypothetical protein